MELLEHSKNFNLKSRPMPRKDVMQFALQFKYFNCFNVLNTWKSPSILLKSIFNFINPSQFRMVPKEQISFPEQFKCFKNLSEIFDSSFMSLQEQFNFSNHSNRSMPSNDERKLL